MSCSGHGIWLRCTLCAHPPCCRFALKDKTNCTLVKQLFKDNHGACVQQEDIEKGAKEVVSSTTATKTCTAAASRTGWWQTSQWNGSQPRIFALAWHAEIAGHTMDHIEMRSNLSINEMTSE